MSDAVKHAWEIDRTSAASGNARSRKQAAVHNAIATAVDKYKGCQEKLWARTTVTVLDTTSKRDRDHPIKHLRQERLCHGASVR